MKLTVSTSITWQIKDQMFQWMFYIGQNTKDLLVWTKCLSGCFGQDQISCKDMVKILYQANKKKSELIKQCRGNWLFIWNSELLTSYHM